jgi:hypothetical protein
VKCTEQQKNAVLLDHLISEERWWDGQTASWPS